MSSEIRANTLKNRVGLGTVSYTNTGIVVSGIVTANSFSGPISGTLQVAEKIEHIADTDTYIQFTPNTINLHSGGTTGLTVYDTNVRIPTKLGINGATPSTPLDVIANTSGYAMAIRGRSSDNIGEIRFTSNDYGSALYSSIQTGATYLNIQVGSATNALRINSDGDVLINTVTTPSADIKLLVNGNGGVSSGSYFSFRGDYGNVPEPAAYAIKYDSSITRLHQYAYGGIAFNLGGQPRVTFTQNGSVGIGTTNANNPLTVHGSGNHIFLKDTATDNVFQMRHQGGTAQFNTYGTGGARRDFVFSQYATEVLRIKSNGAIIKGNAGTQVSLGNQANTQIIGNSAADSSMALIRTAQGGGEFYFAAGSSGTNIANNNGLGFIKFMGYHTDGYDEYARIQCYVDGTNGNGDAPGRITVRTTPDSSATSIARVNIKSDGTIGIGDDVSPSAGDLAGGDSQNKPLIHVKGTGVSATGGEYNLLGRFEAGGDANDTGAMIVLNHSNDRGLALVGGRGTDNKSFGAIKSIDNQGRLTNVMAFGGDNGQGVEYLTFYTGNSTTTTERLRISSNGKIKFATSNSTTDYFEWGGNPRLYLKVPSGTNGLRIDSDTTPLEIRNSSANGRSLSFGSGGASNFDVVLSGDYSLSSSGYDSTPKIFFNTTRHNGSTTSTSFQCSIQGVATSNTNNTGYLGLGASASPDDLVIKTDGNIGINNTNPTAKLLVQDDSNQTQTILKLRNYKSGVNTRPRLAFEASTSGNQGATAYIQGLAGTDADGDANSNDSGLAFIVTHGGSGTERTVMEMTHDGDIIYHNFGTLFGQSGIRVYNTLSGGPQVAISRASGTAFLLNRNTTDGEIVDLRRGWGAGGSIHVGTNSATYNTSSDYRLKENIVPISDGITRLKTLKPSRFNWIGDTNSTRDGFIAHEVTAVPEAITGTKDEVYSENEPGRNIKAGDPKYQGIDQSRLVPLLTAALQEAVAKIEVLETKVAALEGS